MRCLRHIIVAFEKPGIPTEKDALFINIVNTFKIRWIWRRN
jgi:hypothetical protein